MKHLPIRLIRLLVVIALFTMTLFYGVPFASAAPLAIDPFDATVNGLLLVANSATPLVADTVDDASIMGGERDIMVDYISGSGDTRARSVNLGGVFAHAQDPGVRGRTTLTWDGNDSNALTLDPTGLNGVDLTNPTNDAFLLYLVSSDVNTQIRVRVYTDANNWSEALIAVSANTNGQLVTVLFSNFAQGSTATGPADFANVGAIELRINNTAFASVDLDMVIDFFMAADSDSYRDFGDLPDSYGTLLTSNGPRHILSTLYMGSVVDDESTGSPSTGADGDNNAGLDDEDGATRIGTPWSNGTGGGAIRVNVNSPFSACLAGWIDFNADGDFADSGEEIFFEADHLGTGIPSNMIEVNSGNNDLTFDIPLGTFTGSGGNVTLPARFRIVPDRNTDGFCLPASQGGDEPDVVSTGEYFNGEIEDYIWSFTPTAVTLSSLQAQPTTSPLAPLALVGVSALALITVVFFVRRKRTA